MHRDKSAEMAIWQKNSHIAISAVLFLCIDLKNSFGEMTSRWMLWKTYYTLLLKKCLGSCLGPSMYLSERINWIISSFPHWISKILFYLVSWDNFEGLGCRIGTFFFCYSTFWKNTVHKVCPLGVQAILLWWNHTKLFTQFKSTLEAIPLLTLKNEVGGGQIWPAVRKILLHFTQIPARSLKTLDFS